VFFLFLTAQGVHRPDLWEAFFKGADKSQYRSFVHCKHYGFCKFKLAEENPLDMTLVETVESSYCRDLVTPMVQLLRVALPESRSPGDKFVFLSGSTLPVKPFSQVQRALLEDDQSDFCISAAKNWVQTKSSFGESGKAQALLVKHSQWVVLNQNHSRIMVSRWPSVSQGLAWSIPVHGLHRMDGASKGDNAIDIRPRSAHKVHTWQAGVCADEWAIFATIYGAIIYEGQQKEDDLPGLADAPLRITGDTGHPWASPQGRCRTFAVWKTTSMWEDNGKLREQLIEDYPNTVLQKSQGTHPFVLETVSEEGASMLRQSPYLFARKFESHAMTDFIFKRVILSKDANH
jgi:hypothetical protein